MLRSRHLSFVAVLLAISSVATACSGTGSVCEYPDEQMVDGGVKAAVALDVGGLGDKSFNDAAKRGLDLAVEDGLVSEVKCVEANATGANRGENVQGLADAGFDVVIANGYLFSPDILELAPDFPDTNFAVTDGYATSLFDNADTDTVEPGPANVGDLTFKEQEGSFLVGAAAALACDCDTVGFLGGVPNELIGRFEAGFTAGAQYINPDMTVLKEYISDDPAVGFNDAPSGEQLATKMYDAGADLVYHAAGASGAGLFTAAVKADKLAIGVDSDQYLTASADQKPLILTSMLKRVDTAAYEAIKQTGEGNFVSGFQVFGLAEEGVDYSKSNTELMTSDITDQVDEIKQMILDGEIEVPDCTAEMSWCETP
jgi:basic membrane protein A and related proteins